MPVKTDAELQTEANVIKNETALLANDETRVGTMLNNIIENKINIDKISTDANLGDSNLLLPSQKAVKDYVAAKGLGYKELIGVISQVGTDIPTLEVFNNMFGGTVVWARTSAGIYTGTLTGAFTINKTFVTPINQQLPVADKTTYLSVIDVNTISLLVRKISDSSFVDLNLASAIPLEIRAYPL